MYFIENFKNPHSYTYFRACIKVTNSPKRYINYSNGIQQQYWRTRARTTEKTKEHRGRDRPNSLEEADG